MVNIWRNIMRTIPSNINQNDILLVESVNSVISLHQLCMYAYIVCSAKNLTPIFLGDENNAILLNKTLPRYFEHFQVIEKPKLSFLKKSTLILVALRIWAYQLFRKKLILLKWEGLLIGDIIYDQYLAMSRNGTVHYKDIYLAVIIFHVIVAVEKAKNSLNNIGPQALLLSHKVGLSSAPLAVASESNDVPIYSFGGEILRGFSLAMILGVVFGTYSSIYIANPILVKLRVSQKTILKEED